MERKKASDFPQELLNLFDVYVHGGMSRRGFLDRAQKFATLGVSAAALFEMLRPNYAWAIQVPPDDSRIAARFVDHSLPGGRRRHQGLSGPARQFRQIAGGAGGARKSRLEPVYRRRGPAPGCSPISSPSPPTG